jgi:hypothetical protein
MHNRQIFGFSNSFPLRLRRCENCYVLILLRFTVTEYVTNTNVSSRNKPPKTESGILKKGSPDKTLIEGRAKK